MSVVKDFLTRVSFELGASWYARKLREGPETELREEFLEFVGPEPQASVLDVGCGPGYVACRLAQTARQVVGVDRSRAMVRLAGENARALNLSNARFEEASAEELPFRDHSFDLTMATTVLYLMRDPFLVLREMARVTRPAGRLATLDPHASMDVERMRGFVRAEMMPKDAARKLLQWARAAAFYHGFHGEELVELYRRAGLEKIEVDKRLGGMVLFARAALPALRTRIGGKK